MNLLLLAIALLCAVPLEAQIGGSVRGQVRSQQSGAPLPHALVESRWRFRVFRTQADSLGLYRIAGLPAGRHRLRIRHLDHAEHEVTVTIPRGGEQLLDVALQHQPLALQTVTVRAIPAAGSLDSLPVQQRAAGTVASRAMESNPGVTDLGLNPSAYSTGGESPANPSDVLYVRSSAADLKLVLLDGAPVYAPFHLGGLIEPFETEALHSATLHMGGAPARVNGGLSYVLDLRSRAGQRDETRVTGAADGLSARAMVNGPLTERIGYRFGARGVHGRGTEPWLARDSLPYRYRDAVGRVDLDLGRDARWGRISAFGFGNSESVNLDLPVDTLRDPFASDETRRARWSNQAGSLRYTGQVAGHDADLVAGRGTFEVYLPLSLLDVRQVQVVAHQDRFALDAGRRWKGVDVQYGVSREFLRLYYASFNQRNTLRENRQAFIIGRGWGHGAYTDLTWQASSHLRFQAGLRADRYQIRSVNPLDTLRWSPRANLTWMPNPRTAVSFAGGWYSQLVRAPDVLLPRLLGFGTPDPSAQARPMEVATARHFTAGIRRELRWGLQADAEAFYKRLDDVPDALGDTSSVVGTEAWLRRDQGRTTGWLGFSIARVRFHGAADLPLGDWSWRRLLNLRLAQGIGRRGHLGLRLSYGDGVSYTGLPVGTPGTPSLVRGPTGAGGATWFVPESEGAPATPAGAEDNNPAKPTPRAVQMARPQGTYLRLDLEGSRTWTAGWRGHNSQVTPYFRVLNTLRRSDALFYLAVPGNVNDVRGLVNLPVLPLLGLEWRF